MTEKAEGMSVTELELRAVEAEIDRLVKESVGAGRTPRTEQGRQEVLARTREKVGKRNRLRQLVQREQRAQRVAAALQLTGDAAAALERIERSISTLQGRLQAARDDEEAKEMRQRIADLRRQRREAKRAAEVEAEAARKRDERRHKLDEIQAGELAERGKQLEAEKKRWTPPDWWKKEAWRQLAIALSSPRLHSCLTDRGGSGSLEPLMNLDELGALLGALWALAGAAARGEEAWADMHYRVGFPEGYSGNLRHDLLRLAELGWLSDVRTPGSNRIYWRAGPWLAELEQAFLRGKDPAPIARAEEDPNWRRSGAA